MNKIKIIDLNNIKNKKSKIYQRKKTYDYKNIINFDNDISEMDTNIKKIPSIKNKNLFMENFFKKKPFIVPNKFKSIKTINMSTVKHCNSITTSTSCAEKVVKKVTFSTVEIIRVENYKKYNAIYNFPKAQIKKNMEEFKKDNESDSICLIF